MMIDNLRTLETKPEELTGNKAILKKAKGNILKEFEKVCPTDRSFERVVKEMHDIFDSLLRELENGK